jgi:hypothetical protein
MSLKQKIFHETVKYWINVVYLALVLAAFTQYRRFFLVDVGIISRKKGQMRAVLDPEPYLL